MTSNSDTVVPTQHASKVYSESAALAAANALDGDGVISRSGTKFRIMNTLGGKVMTADTSVVLGGDNTALPTVPAVKSYVDTSVSNIIYDPPIYRDAITGHIYSSEASSITAGHVAISAQSFAGKKTFTGGVVTPTCEVATGGGTNTLTVDANSNLKVTSARYRSISLLGDMRVGSGGSPTFGPVDGSVVQLYKFTKLADAYMYGGFVIPHDWKPDTLISIRFRTMVGSVWTAGNTYWSFEYSMVERTGLINLLSPAQVFYTATGMWDTMSYIVQEWNMATIAPGALMAGGSIIYKFGRLATNANDTYTEPIYLISATAAYRCDRVCGDDTSY
jgi:hypothetical protein